MELCLASNSNGAEVIYLVRQQVAEMLDVAVAMAFLSMYSWEAISVLLET